MKMTRADLKALMKELLVEILNEGMGGAVSRPALTSIVGTTTENRTSGRRRPEFDPRLDSPVGKGRLPTDALKEAVKRESAGNPVMADILADTALTTLASQLSHGDTMGQPAVGSGAGASLVQKEQFSGEVADVFGGGAQMRSDGSSHWADLAFMSPGKKSA